MQRSDRRVGQLFRAARQRLARQLNARISQARAAELATELTGGKVRVSRHFVGRLERGSPHGLAQAAAWALAALYSLPVDAVVRALTGCDDIRVVRHSGS